MAEGEEATGEASNTPVEENIPFNKHPRWKQLQAEKDELEGKLSKFDELQATVQQLQESQKTAQENNPTLPADWVALYGNDEASQNAYRIQQQQFQSMEQRIRDDLKKEQAEAAKQQQTEQERWDNWVESELQSLTDAGESFDKNKLMKVALDMQPVDANGNISFAKALQIYKLQESQAAPTNTANKQIAARTASTNRGGDKPKVAPSSNTLRMRSMQSLAQED